MDYQSSAIDLKECFKHVFIDLHASSSRPMAVDRECDLYLPTKQLDYRSRQISIEGGRWGEQLAGYFA